MILAIDSGTTRTRVWSLMDARRPVEGASTLAGARDIAREQGRDRLLARLRELLDGALEAVRTGWDEVEAVVAFGMLTSEFGLVEVPPLVAPTGWPELAAGMVRWSDSLVPAPLLLIPGVRTEAGRTHDADVMRGEETEIVGLLALDLMPPPFLYISPGSHSKFVWFDEKGQIVWSLTTLSGELMWALHEETILAGLIDVGSSEPDSVCIAEGARIAETSGLTRALFVARLANVQRGLSPRECSWLLHGAVAQVDLCALENALPRRTRPIAIALSGRGPMRDCYRHLLTQRRWVREVQVVNEPVGAIGAGVLYETRARAGGEMPLLG